MGGFLTRRFSISTTPTEIDLSGFRACTLKVGSTDVLVGHTHDTNDYVTLYAYENIELKADYMKDMEETDKKLYAWVSTGSTTLEVIGVSV